MSQKMKTLKANRILIVNNDMMELTSMVTGLEAEGFAVNGSINPEAALVMLEAEDYDVVFIDLMLTSMNGLSLARSIKQRFPGVMTMLMSDYLLSPAQLAKADTGASGFVPKPCRHGEIAEFVRKKIDDRRIQGVNLEEFPLRAKTPAPFDVVTVKYSF